MRVKPLCPATYGNGFGLNDLEGGLQDQPGKSLGAQRNNLGPLQGNPLSLCKTCLQSDFMTMATARITRHINRQDTVNEFCKSNGGWLQTVVLILPLCPKSISGLHLCPASRTSLSTVGKWPLLPSRIYTKLPSWFWDLGCQSCRVGGWIKKTGDKQDIPPAPLAPLSHAP